MPQVTFIHGIANKPAADGLHEIWLQSLAGDDGVNLGAKGVTTSMVYWADVMYAEPANEADAHESTGAEIVTTEQDDDLAWASEVQGEERDFVEQLTHKFDFDAASPEDD